MGVNIKPDYQVAIAYGFHGMGIHFAEIADPEVVREIYDLAAKHRGIEVDEDRADVFGYFIGYNSAAASENTACTRKADKLRSFYWVKVSPVFEIRYVARALAHALMEDHGLSVRLIEDMPPDDPSLRSEVIKPSKR